MKKKNYFKNILYKNVKECNIVLLLAIGVLFITMSGYVSYAIFSDTLISNNLITGKIGKVSEEKEFTYTGACEEYEVKYNGYYKIEAWGASGGDAVYGSHTSVAGNGGYTNGIIKLNKGEILNICVGGAGTKAVMPDSTGTATNAGGYNGGGTGYTVYQTDSSACSGGGGSTDIRLVGGAVDDAENLNSRIMVAGGGAGTCLTWYARDNDYYKYTGGNGGGLVGKDGSAYSGYTAGVGGTQLKGGTGYSQTSGFGIGGTGQNASNDTGSGGGSGYYGGGGSTSYASAGGGSSFISGYAGVNAIVEGSTTNPRSHTNNTLHYSNKYFINNTMTPGTNTGNGKAKITYISASQPTRTNKALDKVRYIKDCMNGNNTDSTNRWNELQAIYNGENVAKGITPVTSDGGSITKVNYITDGDIGSTGGTDGYTTSKCIIIDLGQEYDLDEIAIWHNWHSAYSTTKETVTYVSSDNETWNAVMNKEEIETSEGKRVTAFESLLLTISSGENGSLSCTNNTTGITSSTSLTVNKGESITCTGTPNSWYQVSSLKIDDDSYTSGTAFTYNYNYNKTIKATFEKKDTTPPTIPVLTNSSNEEWTTSSVTITATSTDTESGVKTFQYSYDNSTWYNWNDGDLEDITDGKKGTGVWSAVRDATVYIRAIDNVGNISEPATTKVRIKEATLSCDCAYRSSYTVSTGGSWKCSAGHTHTTGYIHYCVCSDGNTYKYTDYATYPDGSYIVTYRWVCPTWNNYTAI